MADKNAKKTEKEAPAAGEGQEAKPSNVKKIILIAVGALLLIGISVGATLFLTGALSKDKEAAAEHEEAKPEEPAHVRAEYMPLQPAFVINYSVKGRQRFLQVGVALLYRDPAVGEALKAHMPVIRNKLVMLFSAESFEVLQTPEGKDALREKTLKAMHEILQQEIGEEGVEQVLFTDFVMQ